MKAKRVFGVLSWGAICYYAGWITAAILEDDNLARNDW